MWQITGAVEAVNDLCARHGKCLAVAEAILALAETKPTVLTSQLQTVR